MRKISILFFILIATSLHAQVKLDSDSLKAVELLKKRLKNDSIIYQGQIAELKEEIKILAGRSYNLSESKCNDERRVITKRCWSHSFSDVIF